MYRSIVLLAVLVSGCNPQPPAPVDLAKEKDAIKSVIAEFGQAYQSKDLAGVSKLVSSSGEFMYFGTDSAEVMKSKADFEAQMTSDWQVFESAQVGEPRNFAIQVSADGQLAFAVWETTLHVSIGGQASQVPVRFADGFKKEDGQWRLIQGVASAATVGQSSAETMKKMKEAKK